MEYYTKGRLPHFKHKDNEHRRALRPGVKVHSASLTGHLKHEDISATGTQRSKPEDLVLESLSGTAGRGGTDRSAQELATGDSGYSRERSGAKPGHTHTLSLSSWCGQTDRHTERQEFSSRDWRAGSLATTSKRPERRKSASRSHAVPTRAVSGLREDPCLQAEGSFR
ncbi:hypothetical protein ACRRTK_003007 [Alexandromys fortis]